MRFGTAINLLTVFLCLFVMSCKKNEKADTKTYNDAKFIRDLSTWLNDQKVFKQEYRNQNVTLLEKHLDYGSMQTEESAANTIRVIPISSEFKRIQRIDQSKVANLVVTINKHGKIIRANVVLVKPKNSMSELPSGTFGKYFTSINMGVDGEFKFLDISGRQNYVMNFSDGQAKSWTREIAKSPTRSNDGTTQVSNCTAYYLVVTYYENGIIVNETETYLGMKCDNGETCGPGYESLCPVGDGGGGSNEDPCCVPPGVSISRAIPANSVSYPNCSASFTDPTSGQTIKNCSFSWPYYKETMWPYSWEWYSTENWTARLDGSLWKLKDQIAHFGQSKQGSSPPCTNVTNSILTWNYSLNANATKANFTITHSSTLQITCCPVCEIEPSPVAESRHMNAEIVHNY